MNAAATINRKTNAAYLSANEFYTALNTLPALFTDLEKKIIARAEKVARGKGFDYDERARYMHDVFATAANYDTFDEAYAALMGKHDGYYIPAMLKAIGERLITRTAAFGTWGSGVTHIEFDRLVHHTAAELSAGVWPGPHAI